MKTEIFYYSGTGNSLFIAKELNNRIPGSELIPIIKQSKRNNIKTSAKTVGFVFPIYFGLAPVPVRNFIKKIDLSSAKYIFAAATCGNYPGWSWAHVEKVLKKTGIPYSYNIFEMTTNTPTGLVPPWMPGFQETIQAWPKHIAKKNVDKINIKIKKELVTFIKRILDKEPNPVKPVSFSYKFIKKPLIMIVVFLIELITAHQKTKLPLYHDLDCNGCGICEKVCLSGKIKMIKKRPFWQENVQCFYCYSCFNFCPEQSILVKDRYTYKKSRYIHPKITSRIIAGQK